MNTYLQNLKKYKFLLSELVKKDIKLKYRRSKLGILWTLIEPILTTIVMAVVFSKMRGKDDPAFPVYILTGRLLYSYFSTATKAAARSIRSNSSMMRKVYVPKYMYPLATVLSNFVTFMISMVVLLGAVILCHVDLTYHLVAGIVPLLILFVMTLGSSLLLATAEVFFRDLEYIWSVALTLIMYCSCIFYSPDFLDGKKAIILHLNPLYAVIKNFRNSVLYGVGFDYTALAYSSVISVILLVTGLYVFCKKQDEFILNL